MTEYPTTIQERQLLACAPLMEIPQYRDLRPDWVEEVKAGGFYTRESFDPAICSFRGVVEQHVAVKKLWEAGFQVCETWPTLKDFGTSIVLYDMPSDIDPWYVDPKPPQYAVSNGSDFFVGPLDDAHKWIIDNCNVIPGRPYLEQMLAENKSEVLDVYVGLDGHSLVPGYELSRKERLEMERSFTMVVL